MTINDADAPVTIGLILCRSKTADMDIPAPIKIPSKRDNINAVMIICFFMLPY